MRQRSYYLDNVCCVLIMHMIYTTHIAYNCGPEVPDVFGIIGSVLSFFMSWFFFKGGMMHKDSTTKELLRKSTKRLLIPYIIFLIVGIGLDFIIKCSQNGDLYILGFLKEELSIIFTISIVWPTGASWFLLSLFVARIFFNVLRTKVHPIIITIAFAFLAYGIFVMQTNNCLYRIKFPGITSYLDVPTFYMGTMCHGLSIYSLGYYLKEKQFSRIWFVPAVMLFVLKFVFPAGLDFRANEVYGDTNLYMLAVVYGMSGCIVMNNLFKTFFDKRIPLITHIGTNSMVYYLVHFPILHTIKVLYLKPYIEYEFLIRFFSISAIITLVLIVADFVFRYKKLRFIIGG